jgi:hypothetical protein
MDRRWIKRNARWIKLNTFKEGVRGIFQQPFQNLGPLYFLFRRVGAVVVRLASGCRPSIPRRFESGTRHLENFSVRSSDHMCQCSRWHESQNANNWRMTSPPATLNLALSTHPAIAKV